jgi:MFS family permease
VFGLAAVIFIYLLRFSQFMTIQQQEVSLRSLRSSLSQMAAAFMAGGVVAWILIIDGFRDIAFKLSADLEPVYLTDIAGISKQGIGLLDGIFGAALLIGLIPAGWLVDRTSERLGIVLALIAAVGSRLVFGFATGFWGFALSWSLAGIGVSLFEPAGSKLITKAVPKHLRGTAFGLLASTLSLFSLPAPWIGSQLWILFGPRSPFLATAALGSLTVVPAWLKLGLPAGPRAAGRPAEAVTLPTIGHSEVVTVLFAKLPANTEDSVHDRWKQILREHGGVLNSSREAVLIACFGTSPHRSPPQVSALLATHAGLSLLEAQIGINPDRAAAAPAKLGLEIGIATGELTTSPAPPEHQHSQGVGFGDELTVMGDLLRAAERLQSFGTHSGGVLISERTYLALNPALHQFVFGRSGPVRLPGEAGESRAYEVLGRARPLGPSMPGGEAPIAG